ncbi:helix-turn-helix transcriptional regulator [Billgrantia kenyensis]|uniref:HTH domain-containing protein n=1 Tax=Billgrantia kenyensis TaxID=321266 RepID=A0A7V9VY27_9GAMM|nr:HTH domain-containing protein [Halomonas kenyensis]MBA2777553.1 HTH domain-containing protein [Halomonas kenyensis]MCG6660223.1 HTH domain-containing protein [Halomonas kenyensis]
MSRTTRLLDLLQILRRHRCPVSGTALAQELGVSLRTLYRDIASLRAIGAEIEGEPGMGYRLEPGLMLPPLMTHTTRGSGSCRKRSSFIPTPGPGAASCTGCWRSWGNPTAWR